jgi:squalene-associated FAD-dependent desaturase
VTRTVHIIGAGLAGLAAATALAPGRRVIVHEAARLAGGRCRSYFDPTLGLTIDNGNHLLLSGNRAAQAFLARIGAPDALTGPDECVFDFAHLATGARWRLRPNAGRIPWWIFDSSRRVPETGWRDYAEGANLLRAGSNATIAQVMRRRGEAWRKLWDPVFVSALNTASDEASARLAGAVLRESLGAGGMAARPRVARDGLGPAFIDPALAMLAKHGADVRFGARLRALTTAGERIAALHFGDEAIAIGAADRVILATPPWIATDLVPGLTAPNEFRGILNAHFACAPPVGTPLLTGLTGGTSEWLFAFDGRLSVTVSAADRFMDASRDELAATIWAEVARVTGAPPELPPWQIVKEKRATFAATPAQDALRPDATTRWPNLVLAGDWTQTGLPATIEGAIRSGDRAAALV